MKLFYCIVINLLSCYVISQNNAVILEGTVTIDGEKDPLENAIIHLKLSSGAMLEEKTNALGKYKFTVKDTTSNFSITLVTDKSTRSLSKSSSCFLASKDEGKGTLKANVNFVKDFQLVKGMDCGGQRIPALLFTTNSILSCNDSLHKIAPESYETFENAVTFLYQLLKENPTIIIELQGHASSIDKKPEQIALKRAQAVKEALISKGVDRKRIQTKGWGTQKPLVKNDIIKRAKTTEEKIALNLKNQRVVFRIVSWDLNSRHCERSEAISYNSNHYTSLISIYVPHMIGLRLLRRASSQ